MGRDHPRLISSKTRLELKAVLAQAQQYGWVGPGSLDHQIDHSEAFAAVAAAPPTVAVDLGSGGGLPALVLAAAWPHSQWTLVESALRRAAFLEERSHHLGWADRVTVVHGRAQDLGHREECRAQADLVTARCFGSASLTMETAAPLLRVGGELVVSAAPDATPWPTGALAELGMGPDRLTLTSPRLHIVTQEVLTPHPRPRPLWPAARLLSVFRMKH